MVRIGQSTLLGEQSGIITARPQRHRLQHRQAEPAVAAGEHQQVAVLVHLVAVGDVPPHFDRDVVGDLGEVEAGVVGGTDAHVDLGRDHAQGGEEDAGAVAVGERRLTGDVEDRQWAVGGSAALGGHWHREVFTGEFVHQPGGRPHVEIGVAEIAAGGVAPGQFGHAHQHGARARRAGSAQGLGLVEGLVAHHHVEIGHPRFELALVEVEVVHRHRPRVPVEVILVADVGVDDDERLVGTEVAVEVERERAQSRVSCSCNQSDSQPHDDSGLNRTALN